MFLNKLRCSLGRLLQGAVQRVHLLGEVVQRTKPATVPEEALMQQVNCKRYLSKKSAICGTTKNASNKVLTMDTVNPNILRVQYAVRGPLVTRALEIEKELAEGVKKPFDQVIKANIGDAHAMQQQPLTFIRQVLACVTCPSIMDKVDFPVDVKERACLYLNACGGGSVGSYTMSNGIDIIRKDAARYIEDRDKHTSNYENICFTTGASTGIKIVLGLFCNNINNKVSGVMIPIPQYPLYSAALAELGLAEVGYYLDEDNGWALDKQELERAYSEGSKGCRIRALVVINPGNPTGQVLSRENIETVIKFAEEKNLFLFADEVYQHNIYVNKFHSFKKVTQDMGAPYSKLELVSFMSLSKGYMGECGLRSGWMELVNMDPEVQGQLYKAMSAMLCPPSLGQIALGIVARPPKLSDPSFELFKKEKSQILDALAERAAMVVETFNKMEGFKCNVVQGSMYAFPRIDIPKKAIEAAKKENKIADQFYAFRLLEETGICIIPGSGFGQKPSTYHFRTTILPQTPMLKKMLKLFQSFHSKFTKEFS